MAINSPGNQITLFINPESSVGKQTRAYAVSENLPIREVDLTKEHLTGTQLVELSDRLGLDLENLANKDFPDFNDRAGESKAFDKEDWVKFLVENPDLIRSPIALKGDKAKIVTSPPDIMQL